MIPSYLQLTLPIYKYFQLYPLYEHEVDRYSTFSTSRTDRDVTIVELEALATKGTAFKKLQSRSIANYFLSMNKDVPARGRREKNVKFSA